MNPVLECVSRSLASLRLRKNVVIYRTSKLDPFELERMERLVTSFEEYARRFPLRTAVARLNADADVVIRWFRGGSFALALERSATAEMLQKLQAMDDSLFLTIGGGLSASSTIDLSPNESEIITNDSDCSMFEVVEFLNELGASFSEQRANLVAAFGTVTGNTPIQVRDGRCFTVSVHKGGYLIDYETAATLERVYAAVMPRMDQSGRIRALKTAPMNSPPWRRLIERRRFEQHARAGESEVT